MHAVSRRTLVAALAGAVVVAAALGTTLVLVGRGGGASQAVTTATSAPATRAALLRGLPQSGIVLGDPKAPALVEYVDLQCPYCAEFSARVLPSVVREYVRTGKVKLVFHGLAFVGPDSVTALRAVEAAGLQNRLWDVLEGLYAVQGTENSGWVTRDLLTRVGDAIPGLDVERWLADAGSDAVARRIEQASLAAQQSGIRGTPSFVFAGRQLRLASLDPADFRAALQPLLGQ